MSESGEQKNKKLISCLSVCLSVYGRLVQGFLNNICCHQDHTFVQILIFVHFVIVCIGNFQERGR